MKATGWNSAKFDLSFLIQALDKHLRHNFTEETRKTVIKMQQFTTKKRYA